MAIKTNTGFEIGSIVPVDARIALTTEQMLNINDNTQPDKYFAINQDNGKLYLYDKAAEPNEVTGKFSLLEGGDGAQIWEGTRAEYEKEKDTIAPGTLIVITDDGGDVASIFYDCTQEEYDELPDDKLSNGIAYMISEEGSTTVKLVRNGKEISGSGDAVIEIDELPEEVDNKVYICNTNTIFYPFETAANYDVETAEAALQNALDAIGVTYQITKTSSSVLVELDYDNSKNEMKVYYPENTVAKNVTKIKYDVALSGDCAWKSNQNGETEYLFTTVSHIVLGWSGEGVDVTKTVFAKDVELATKEYVDSLPAGGIEVNVEEEATETLENVKVNDTVYKVDGGDAVIEADVKPKEPENKVYKIAKPQTEFAIDPAINTMEDLEIFLEGLDGIAYKRVTLERIFNPEAYILTYSSRYHLNMYSSYTGELLTEDVYIIGIDEKHHELFWGHTDDNLHETGGIYIATYVGISDTISERVFAKDIELVTKEYVKNFEANEQAVLHVARMPAEFKDKVYVQKGRPQGPIDIRYPLNLTRSGVYTDKDEMPDISQDEEILVNFFEDYDVRYTREEVAEPYGIVYNLEYDGELDIVSNSSSRFNIKEIGFFYKASEDSTGWSWCTRNTAKYNQVPSIKYYFVRVYDADKRVERAFASDMELATKDYVDTIKDLAQSVNLKAAMAVDAKPVYNEEDKTITYIQNGVTGTTDNLDQWFYYIINDQMYQTIWIGGIEQTILSAGEEVDAMRVKLTKADDTKKSLQTMYEDGELGGGTISMTKAEWEVYNKDSLNDKAEIIITDDVEDGGDIPIAIMSFDTPIYDWMNDSNNSSTNAVEADKDGIAVCTTRHYNASSMMFHEIDLDGVDRRIVASDNYAGNSYVDPVTFPVKKGYKYWAELNGNSIASYLGGIKFYPFKSEIVQPLKAEDKYSTEETVVGEWIDGKPIYRRVIVYTGSVGANTKIDSTLTYSYIDSIVSYNITGLDKGNTIIPISTAAANQSTGAGSCDWWIQNGFYVGVGNSRTITKITAIFEYTKK